jgi:hypothetical protein
MRRSLIEEFLINIDPLSRYESMRDYSRRVIQSSGARGHYDLVVGCSLGGIIAQEGLESRLFTTDRLLLLSSAFSGGNISGLFLPLIPILYLLPSFLYAPLHRIIATLYPLFRFRFPMARSFSSMLRRTSVSLFFIAPLMVRKWRRGKMEVEFPPMTLHMHGMSDPLFSYKKIRRFRTPEYPIYRGNHLVFVTEAKFIAQIFMKMIAV